MAQLGVAGASPVQERMRRHATGAVGSGPLGPDPRSSALGDRTVLHTQHFPGYYSTTRDTTVLPGVLYYPGYYCNTRGTTALSLWRYAIGDYRAAISSTRDREVYPGAGGRYLSHIDRGRVLTALSPTLSRRVRPVLSDGRLPAPGRRRVRAQGGGGGSALLHEASSSRNDLRRRRSEPRRGRGRSQSRRGHGRSPGADVGAPVQMQPRASFRDGTQRLRRTTRGSGGTDDTCPSRSCRSLAASPGAVRPTNRRASLT